MRRENNRNGKNRKKLVARLTAVALSCMMLAGGGITAFAATTMEDVFDARAYADAYPDLKAAFGYNEKALTKHYLTFGASEGRKGFGLIDLAKYRAMNADLDAAFGDNWEAYLQHYLTYGAAEGRETGTGFDPLAYGARYADLTAAFGKDIVALHQHYQAYGKTENREARSEAVVAEEQRREEEAREEEERESSQAESPDQSGTISQGHTERIDYEGGYQIYEYNADNQETKRSTYDSADQLQWYMIWEYDASGRLTKSTTYDGADKVTKWTTYEYNADGIQKATFYNEEGKITNIDERDASGQLISRTYF